MNIPLNRNVVKPELIVFDWDNTLVHSWPIIHESLNHTMDYMSKPAWSMTKVKTDTKYSLRESFVKLFGDEWTVARDKYLSHYREHHLDRIKPYPKAVDFLTEIQDLKIPMAVISNKTGATLRKEVSHFGWGDIFKSVIGAGDYEKDKPNPIVMEATLSSMNFPAVFKNFWMVGDSAPDIALAQNTGGTGVLLSPDGPALGLDDYIPDIAFDGFANFIQTLRQLS